VKEEEESQERRGGLGRERRGGVMIDGHLCFQTFEKRFKT
jgi:hypothetical protein